MDAKTMRGGWGEAEIVWFESGCVICRAADHAEAIGHRPQAIPVDGMFSKMAAKYAMKIYKVFN